METLLKHGNLRHFVGTFFLFTKSLDKREVSLRYQDQDKSCDLSMNVSNL